MAKKQTPSSRTMLNDTVLLRRIDIDDSVSDGGVLKPQLYQQRSNKAEVIAVAKNEVEVKVGDTVTFTRYGGTDVEIDGVDYIIVHKKQLYWVE